jgi:hypothetical protein
MKFTRTSPRAWESGRYKLGPIPKSPEKQVILLERAVAELFDMLMDELGWDNPGSVADELSDEVNRIAHKAYEKHCDE